MTTSTHQSTGRRGVHNNQPADEEYTTINQQQQQHINQLEATMTTQQSTGSEENYAIHNNKPATMRIQQSTGNNDDSNYTTINQQR
jgi:hypothetical protein